MSKSPTNKEIKSPTNKEIFFTLFPEGYQSNVLFGDLNPNEQKYYVKCQGKCNGHITRSSLATAYGNPVTHAKSCYGESNLLQLVIETRDNNDGDGNSDSKKKKQTELFASLLAKATPSEIALDTWMGLVCLYNTPITRMSDKVFCKYLMCEETSYKTFVATMFELSLIVEAKIQKEMEGKVGTILHDGWSKYSRHYIALLACYMVDKGKRDGNNMKKMEPVITLLTCSTLPYNEDEDEDEDGDNNAGELATMMLCILSLCLLFNIFSTVADFTATSFNAESHIQLMKNTFHNLNFDNVGDFAIGQTSDSTALNPRIARMLYIYHIACRNHCLNLGCKDMEKNCPELKEISEKTQSIHRKIKASNKLTAVMENAQASASELGSSHPKLKLLSKTRWNALEAMLSNHKKTLDAIKAVVDANPNLELDEESTTKNFVRRIDKHLGYLTTLKKASVNMQKTGATLDDCQFQCDTITKLSSAGSGVKNHEFEHCR
jgi:hypothetical protein